MVDTIEEWEDYAHHSEIAGALESFRDEEIPGKIVRIEYPSDKHGCAKIIWAGSGDPNA